MYKITLSNGETKVVSGRILRDDMGLNIFDKNGKFIQFIELSEDEPILIENVNYKGMSFEEILQSKQTTSQQRIFKHIKTLASSINNFPKKICG